MSRFDLSHTPGLSSDEPAISSHDGGKTGEMLRPASVGQPMTLRQCLCVVGLFVIALLFSYIIVFRIDPFAVDLHRSTSHAESLVAAPHGDRP